MDMWAENTALGLNSQGVVVGTTPRWSMDPDPRRAFTFKRGNVLPLGGLGGHVGEARDVNDWGFAVGGSLDAEGHYRAVSYFNGVVTDLGSLDGTNSWAWGVNNFGFAVGNGFVSGVAHAAGFFHGRVFDLGSIGGETYANAVNDLFEVAGTGRLADGTWSGFVLRKGKMAPLGEFGIPVPSTAVEINNRGTVCGSSYDPSAYLRQAFLLYRDGSVVNLPDLGYPFTYCSDVSNTGVAVGIADDGITGWRAVAWMDPSEPPIDLNTRVVPAMPDVQLYWASKTNSFGMITVYGFSFTKLEVGGYLLSPMACPN
jgi:probable HAF family extracellular repeat protein